MGGLTDLLVFEKKKKKKKKINEKFSKKVSKAFPVEEIIFTYRPDEDPAEVSVQIWQEAYRKRQYKGHFILKVSDSDAENSKNPDMVKFTYLLRIYIQMKHIIHYTIPVRDWRMLNNMISPEKFECSSCAKLLSPILTANS